MNNRNINNSTFRKIKSLKFLYEVNPVGVVRNTKSKKIMKPKLDKDGYYVITFNNKSLGNITARVHRLVAECYIDNPNNLPVVNHKDENKINNDYRNLEWCTVQYNNIYGSRLESCSKTISETLKNKKSFKYYYAEDYNKYFETSREAAEYVMKNYPEYKNINTIMRRIRQVSEKNKGYAFKTKWKRIS